ncbi:MAG: ACT domain-containing protein [Gammaproteobacteria bacterium]|nr:ACT domain-containing protein [Gammaproteobacteria bacterium]
MKQISIVSDNRAGVMAEITDCLAKENINIDSIDAETFGDYAVTILTVNKYDLALQNLRQIPGIKCITEDAILIRLKDEPGALAKIAMRFKDANINIRSLRFIKRDDTNGLVAISTDRTQEALDLVKDVLVS